MIDINDYKIKFKNDKSITKIWIVVFVFIIIGVFYINNSFKYYDYYTNVGEYRENYLNLYVLVDDLEKIKKEEIYIEEKKFAYEIKEISKENIYLNNNYYKEVKLIIKENKLIENEIVDIKIIINKMSILEYVFKTVWR
ncbi:MAG: hypothetical protein E7162_03780 [Firmicutes bacterium]|nr:hypothetical protein [Bacillota bacterium]